MALQVWLPFTDGTLKQQGLSSDAATQTGTINLTNAGKLGKCVTFGTAGGGVTLPASTMTSFTECSVAFWIKVISWNTSYATFFQAGLGSTPWAHYIFGILRNGTNSNLCFTLTNSNGSSTSASYTSSNLEVGQWYHLAFTYKAGTVCIYKDGALDKTYNTTYVPNFAGITHISIGRGTNNSSYQTNCGLNDFRIYDHCLSPMEVKELAKGLILHYPLNRNSWGQENIVRNSNKFKTGGHASGITPSVEADGTYKVVAESGNSNYSSSWWWEMTGIEDSFVENEPFTVSFWIKSSDANKTKPPTIYLKSGMGYYSMQGSVSANYSQVYYTGTWKKTNNLAPHLGWSGLVGTYYICHWKIEKGTIATPWCPNSSDVLATTMGLNSITEYDCSGFCNNGTRTGTFSWTSDTPKYSVSTYMPKAALITHPRPVFGGVDQEWTCAMWVKLDTTNQANQNMNNFNSNNSIIYSANGVPLLYLNSGTNDYYMYGSEAVSAGVWTHVVFVFKNSEGLRNIYINGVLKNNYGPNKTSTPAGIPDTVTIGTNLAGYISDYRIYATALSPSDVKSLYQNCATIDPDGTIRGQIRS